MIKYIRNIVLIIFIFVLLLLPCFAGEGRPSKNLTAKIDQVLPEFKEEENIYLGSGSLTIKNKLNVWVRVGMRFLDFEKKEGKDVPVFNKRGANFWIAPKSEVSVSVGVLGASFFYVFTDRPTELYIGDTISLMLFDTATLELNITNEGNYKIERIR